MSGMECIKKVKKKSPQIQFMMFTIYENREPVYETLAAGASGYLLKKTPLEKILEALKELYKGGAPMSAHIARKVVSFFQKENKVTSDNTQLSNREKEVLALLSKGFLYKEISNQLFISTGTVRQHIHNIYGNCMYKTGWKPLINIMEGSNFYLIFTQFKTKGLIIIICLLPFLNASNE